MLVHEIHDVAPAAECADRVAAPQRLAIGHEVGDDTVIFLGAAIGEPKASDDLIEDQQQPGCVAELANTFEKSRLRRGAMLQRLHDDARKLMPTRPDDRLGAGQIVIGGDEQLGVDRSRTGARMLRLWEGQISARK
jgi:hypothetical protein